MRASLVRSTQRRGYVVSEVEHVEDPDRCRAPLDLLVADTLQTLDRRCRRALEGGSLLTPLRRGTGTSGWPPELDLDRDIATVVARANPSIACLSVAACASVPVMTVDQFGAVVRRGGRAGRWRSLLHRVALDRDDAVAAHEPDPVTGRSLRPASVTESRTALVTSPVATDNACLGHLLDAIRLDAGLGVVHDECCQRLGHRAGRASTTTCLAVSGVDLFGDGDDVLVVRQDHDLIGIDPAQRCRAARTVDGFIVCPPVTTPWTPSWANSSTRPSPAAHRDDRGRDRRAGRLRRASNAHRRVCGRSAGCRRVRRRGERAPRRPLRRGR